jgi:tetratricopeptide (TPR) repeat protein
MMRSAAIILLCAAWAAFGAQEPVDRSAPALRRLFNEAAEKLNAGKNREAESLLESLLAAQREELQSPALYNLGHARFAEGVEELKKSEKAGPAAARGRAAAMQSEGVITDARSALQGAELRRLINSYMQGRGALRDLRGSIKAITRALQFHAVALNRWERASSDWKSALELDPRNDDARHNAEVADRHIAKLIDSIRDLQQALQAMQMSREQLKSVMQQLKGKIPEENMPPGASGEEEEDEEGGMQPPPGHEEAPGQEGEERPISPEEAGWMLDGLKPGEERRLPMGQEAEGKPRDKNRPTW